MDRLKKLEKWFPFINWVLKNSNSFYIGENYIISYNEMCNYWYIYYYRFKDYYSWNSFVNDLVKALIKRRLY